MTSKEINEIEQAAKDGKRIQTSNNEDQWADAIPETIKQLIDGTWDWKEAAFYWRIVPAPVTAPLGPEDVPPGSVVRCNSKTEARNPSRWINIESVSDNTVCLPVGMGGLTFTFEGLMKHGFEISRDNGKTWHPCSKELKQ